jgi:hypothetical protein
MDRQILNQTNILPFIFTILGLIGLLIFRLPSSEGHPKIYELHLADVWLLMSISCNPNYTKWSDSHLNRKIFTIASSIFMVFNLVKLFN